MKTNFGLRIVCLAFWLNATVWVCAESPPEPLRVSFKDGFVELINGTPADTSDLGRAVEMIEDKTKVVQVYRESQRPFPASSLSTIFRRGLGVQFAFKPNFSDISVNTPAMRVHEEPNVEGENIGFTGFISDVCPVHREKMNITKVQWLREFDPKLISMISREQCNKQFPFPGAAIAGVYFKGTADVYECPTCSRGFEAMVKEIIGPPKIVGNWSTYATIVGVPKDLMDAFMKLDETSIADAGEPFAFTCMATPYEARRQFVLAGIRGNVGFFIWLEGGAAVSKYAATFVKSKDGWEANTVPDGGDPKTWKKKFHIHVPYSHGEIDPAGCVKAIEENIAGKK